MASIGDGDCRAGETDDQHTENRDGGAEQDVDEPRQSFGQRKRLRFIHWIFLPIAQIESHRRRIQFSRQIAGEVIVRRFGLGTIGHL